MKYSEKNLGPARSLLSSSSSKAAAFALVIASGATTASHAAMVTYEFNLAQNYGSDSLHALVAVDDDTPGFLSFNVSIDPNATLPNIADLFGVFLEFDPSYTTGTIAGNDVTGVDTNTINMGGGNNLNGSIASLVPGGNFDYGITLGTSGSSSGLLQSTLFTLSDNGGAVGLADIVGIGLRAQSTGLAPNGGNGSSKLYSTVTTPPNETPPTSVPDGGTTLLSLGVALLGLGGVRRWMQRN